MISDEKKEEVRAAADIVDVVSDYVKLRRSGSGFTGLCPFHNEKTPSFNVTPRLGIYKCFGCGAGGDVFNFIMEMEGIGFTEAVKTLANRYGVFIPEEEDQEYDAKYHLTEGIYHALRYAGLYYYRNLIETDEAAAARDYLKKRGFTKETIKKYGLGYSPDNRTALYRAAMDSGLNEQYLHGAGLIKEGPNGEDVYDTFRGRLMFPIFNTSGKVIAFGGRVLGQAKTAKYINSPQTQVYNKSEVLYGIQVAKNEIRKEDEVILVEGYTDVLSLHQAGVRNVVSTSGTALTSGQLRIMHRYSDNLLMIYDADSAGQNAMERGLNLALSEGLSVRLLQLPEGEDPDTFVKQFGGESFREFKKEHAEDFVTFLVNKAKKSGDWDSPIDKNKVITRIIQSIANIPDAMSRETFIQHLNQLAKVGDVALFEKLNKAIDERNREQKRERERLKRSREVNGKDNIPAKAEPANKVTAGNVHDGPPDLVDNQRDVKKESFSERNYPLAEKEILRLMLEYGRSMVEYIGGLCNEDHFEDDWLRSFFLDMIKSYHDDKEISIEMYMAREQPYPMMVSEIVMEPHGVSEKGVKRTGVVIRKDADPYKTAKGALKALKIHYLERMNRKLSEALKKAEGDEKVVLSQNIKELGQARKRLEVFSLDDLFPDPPDAHPDEQET